MDKNEELRIVQAKWVEEVLEKYITDCTNDETLREDKQKRRKDCEISCPFCMGLTDNYIDNENNKTKVMIIGQQPLGFGCWNMHRKDFEDSQSEWSHIKLQQWAREYLDTQLKKESKSVIKYNPSPFWRLFQALNEDYTLCWNDIDKVYYGKKENDYHEGTLTYLAEKKLSAPFEYDGKTISLLKREIEIANPDVVVFVTGPSYALSMGTALEYENSSKKNIDGTRPTKENPVVKLNDIKYNGKEIQVLWTYHPGYLTQTRDNYNNSLFNSVIDEIKKHIENK